MGARKAKPRKDPKAASRGALLGIGIRGLIAVALVAGVVAGVAWLGQRAGEQVAHRDRYTVRFADIQCDAPPATDRAVFLTEVRSLGNLPETIQAVDPELPARLTAVFTRHPWVAEVTEVRVEPDTTIRVGLRFRTPVLAVRVQGEPDARWVDRTAVLLPGPASGQLPELVTAVRAPQKPAGQVWDDPTVKRAAELAAEYRPRRIEKTDRGWRMTLESGKVLLVSF